MKVIKLPNSYWTKGFQIILRPILLHNVLFGRGFVVLKGSTIFKPFRRTCCIWKGVCKNRVTESGISSKLIIVERRRAIGHYGDEDSVSDEDALESFQWAEEFMQAVKDYLKV